MLTACGGSTATRECLVFGPIHPSRADTTDTQDQVAVHNARGAAVCGW